MDLPVQVQCGEQTFVHDFQSRRGFHPALRRNQEMALRVSDCMALHELRVVRMPPTRTQSFDGFHSRYCDEYVPPESYIGTLFVLSRTRLRTLDHSCMQITGKEEEELIVSGGWLIRGQSIQPLMDANDDANW